METVVGFYYLGKGKGDKSWKGEKELNFFKLTKLQNVQCYGKRLSGLGCDSISLKRLGTGWNVKWLHSWLTNSLKY